MKPFALMLLLVVVIFLGACQKEGLIAEKDTPFAYIQFDDGDKIEQEHSGTCDLSFAPKNQGCAGGPNVRYESDKFSWYISFPPDIHDGDTIFFGRYYPCNETDMPLNMSIKNVETNEVYAAYSGKVLISKTAQLFTIKLLDTDFRNYDDMQDTHQVKGSLYCGTL